MLDRQQVLVQFGVDVLEGPKLGQELCVISEVLPFAHYHLVGQVISQDKVLH